jgi:membrane protease YdiL (CAAX protease family)
MFISKQWDKIEIVRIRLMLIRTDESISVGVSPRSISLIKVANPDRQEVTARRGLLLFFPLLIALSTLFYWLIIVKHDNVAMALFMWTPGSAALATRLILREKFPTSTLFFNKRLLQPLAVALLAPLTIGLLAYGLAWKTGITPLVHFHASANIAALLSLTDTSSSLFALAGSLLLIIGGEIISASGEEIGWRGYMLPRLIRAGVPQPVLVGGIIWSLWHWPLLLLTPSSSTLPQIVVACIFLVTITSLGCISAHLRLTTGNLWPSILLHAAWNGIILEIFDACTKGADTSIWTGESGLLVAVMTILVAFVITRMRKGTKGRMLVTLKEDLMIS